MLLQITTTHQPATDLGYLLGKHPDRFQSKELSFGKAHVFYPEAQPDKCSVVLLLEMNPVLLSRQQHSRGKASYQLEHYVNDRPYVASSFLSTAISKVFGSALNGRCKDRPHLVSQALPLEVSLPTIVSKGGEGLIRKLFEPLGYELDIKGHPLDENFPQWGESPYFSVGLHHTISLQTLLNHLFVLMPVLDNSKHYFVNEMEIEKLQRNSSDWISGHPMASLIIRRYLKHKKSYARQFVKGLEKPEVEGEENPAAPSKEELLETSMNLHQTRLQRVCELLKASGAKSALDLGCGGGKLLKLLVSERQFDKIVGMDVSFKSLEVASRRLYLKDASPAKRERIQLIQGALTYRDDRLAGFDAAALVEVIEHLDPYRLEAFEKVVFQHARPAILVLTTPNREYNALFEGLTEGKFRHSDHRFEWTRAEFEQWANATAERHNYKVRFEGVGPVDATHGSPSQLAVFERKA
ncbi:MAG: 3' terminal RNA ribose 2'-O-methyltransferase Hen1 [Bacteroidota bacterium]